MTDPTQTARVPLRVVPPEEAVQTWDQTIPGYDPDEAAAEAQRALQFDLDLATAGCPFHVDARRLVEHASRGEWDEAARVVHDSHFMPQTLGMHCHRYCETALLPNGGLTNPRPERIRIPDWSPNLSALEWAAGRLGARPELPQGEPTGKRVAVVGGGSAGLMCAWVLRQSGHEVHIFDRDPLPGGLLMSGYPSFRLEKGVTRRENDPLSWGVFFHGEHEVTPGELRAFTEEFDAVFFGPGRVPRRQFVGPDGRPLPGEDLEGVLTGTDILHDTWYGNPPTIGPRVMVFGGGQTAIDVARTARRLGCEVHSIYRRGPWEMQVGPAPEISIRWMEEEGITVRPMADPRRFIGENGRLTHVELVTMEYGDVDESGRLSTHPVAGSEEIIPVDTVVRAIGEVYDVKRMCEPLGIEVMPGGYIHIDPVSKRTAHPKVWAGGDVCAGRGNHGSAFDGMWAGRSIDAYLSGRFQEWLAEADASNDADLLYRDAAMEPIRGHPA